MSLRHKLRHCNLNYVFRFPPPLFYYEILQTTYFYYLRINEIASYKY